MKHAMHATVHAREYRGKHARHGRAHASTIELPFFLFPSNNPIAVYQYYITFIRCIAVTRLDVRARTYTPLHARTHARAPIRFNLPAGYKTHQYLTNPCLHDTRRTSSSPVEKFFTSRQYTTQKTPKNNFRKYFSQKFIQLKKNWFKKNAFNFPKVITLENLSNFQKCIQYLKMYLIFEIYPTQKIILLSKN